MAYLKTFLSGFYGGNISRYTPANDDKVVLSYVSGQPDHWTLFHKFHLYRLL